MAGPACSERPTPIQRQGRPPEFTIKRLESKMLPVSSRRRKVSYLIQDQERARWTAEPRKPMREIGVKLLESFPKCSQDLNPIETVWREIRARLNDTEPQKMEARKVFLQRLRNAVAWVNTSRSNLLKELCEDQKDRAKEVLERKGGRTSF